MTIGDRKGVSGKVEKKIYHAGDAHSRPGREHRLLEPQGIE